MRKQLVLTMLAGASCGLWMSSCSNDEDFAVNETPIAAEGDLVTGIRVTLPDCPFATETRTAHSIVGGAMHTDWQLGDTLGIYPIGGDQVAFPISDGEGTSTARFNGGSWALRSSYQYAAYYPFDRRNVFVQEDRLAFDYTGQVQDGDGSLAHLSAYDFLAAGAANTDEDGAVDLTLNHLGCFVRMELTVPEANTLKIVRVKSNNVPFVVKGSVDLSSATPVLTSVTTSTYTEINLNNIVVGADETVTIYMMMAPVDLSGSTLTFSVDGSNAVTYSQTLSVGKNMVAGNAYSYALALEKEVSQFAAVDLGLPSGTKWASCNLGASAPEQEGDYYAWGEITNAHHWRTDVMPDYKYDENGMPLYDENGNQLWDPVDWVHMVFWREDYQYYVPGRDAYTDEDGFSYPAEQPTYTYIGNKINDNQYAAQYDISGTQYDVAKAKLGGTWRMPTLEDYYELVNNCTCTFATYRGHNGMRIAGPNGKWIFIAQGIGKSSSEYGWEQEEPGLTLWLSTGSEWNSESAYYLSIYTDYGTPQTGYMSCGTTWRWYGVQVRPVCN